MPNKLHSVFSEKYLETNALSNQHLNLTLSLREIIKGLIKCIGLNINKTLALDLTIDQVYPKQSQISKVMFISTYNNYFMKVFRFGSYQKFVFAKFFYVWKYFRVTQLQTVYSVSRLIVVVHLINSAECCNSFSATPAASNEKQHSASCITSLTICSIDLSHLFYCCLPIRIAKYSSDICGFVFFTNVQDLFEALPHELVLNLTWIFRFSILQIPFPLFSKADWRIHSKLSEILEILAMS